MNITDENVEIANELRTIIQERTETISDGEGVTMVLLWTFFIDHAAAMDMNIEGLAKDQMAAFIEFARGNLIMTGTH